MSEMTWTQGELTAALVFITILEKVRSGFAGTVTGDAAQFCINDIKELCVLMSKEGK